MRRKLAFGMLAFACLISLPLAAAPGGPADPGVPSADAAPTPEAPAIGSQTPSAGSETPSAGPEEVGIESILDDGRQEMSCTKSSCDRYCKTNYGSWSFGFCSGGVCTCAI